MSIATIKANREARSRVWPALVDPGVWLLFLFLVTSTQVDAATSLAQVVAVPGYLVVLTVDLFELAIVPLSGAFWPVVVALCYVLSVAAVAAYRTVRR